MLMSDRKRPSYTANAEDEICSRGKSISRCKIWGRFIQYVNSAVGADFGEKYTNLVNMVKDEAGDNTVVSDSSKYLKPLRKVVDALWECGREEYELTIDDLVVVYLVSDVQAWATSMKYCHGIGIVKWTISLNLMHTLVLVIRYECTDISQRILLTTLNNFVSPQYNVCITHSLA